MRQPIAQPSTADGPPSRPRSTSMTGTSRCVARWRSTRVGSSGRSLATPRAASMPRRASRRSGECVTPGATPRRQYVAMSGRSRRDRPASAGTREHSRARHSAEQGEAVGVVLFAVDALPAAQRRLAHGSRRPRPSGPTPRSRARRRDGGAGWRGRRTRTTPRRAGRSRPGPGRGRRSSEPVADRGAPALDLVQPQPDGPDAASAGSVRRRSRTSSRRPRRPAGAGAR